jgi:hypothetical protein
MSFLGPVIQNLPMQTEWFFFSGAICGIIILFFVIWILICVWIYRDAESRGMSGALWLIIVLIASLLGLIIYFIVREDKKSRYPQQAQYGQPPAQRGYPPPQQPYQPATHTGARFCKNCGAGIQSSTRFCPNCGQRT